MPKTKRGRKYRQKSPYRRVPQESPDPTQLVSRIGSHARIQKVLPEGVKYNSDNVFIVTQWIQIPQKAVHPSSPVCETPMASLAGRLNAGIVVIFQGIHASIAKEPLSFVIFQEGPDPPPSSESANGSNINN